MVIKTDMAWSGMHEMLPAVFRNNFLSNIYIHYVRGSPITYISKNFLNTFGRMTNRCGAECNFYSL